jgi:hypothetical protein
MQFAKNSNHLVEKWDPILNCESQEPITDPYKRAVTAILLENQQSDLQQIYNYSENHVNKTSVAYGNKNASAATVSLAVLVNKTFIKSPGAIATPFIWPVVELRSRAVETGMRAPAID